MQGESHLILGIIGEIGIGCVGYVMQDYTFTIQEGEIELFSGHGQVQGLSLALPVLFHIICFHLLNIMQLDRALSCPGEDGIGEAVYCVEEKVLSYFYV